MRFNNFLTLLIISIVLMSACHNTKEIASTDNVLAESKIIEEVERTEFEKIYKNKHQAKNNKAWFYIY